MSKIGGAPTGPRFNRDGSVHTQSDKSVVYAGLDE